MEKLIKDLTKKVNAYAKKEGAEYDVRYDAEAQQLNVEVRTGCKMAGVYYGPDDFAAGTTADDIMAFLKATWENA